MSGWVGVVLFSLFKLSTNLLCVLILIEMFMLLLLGCVSGAPGLSLVLNNSCIIVWSVVGAAIGLSVLSILSRMRCVESGGVQLSGC